MNKTTVALVVIGLSILFALISFSGSSLVSYFTISNAGKVKTIGVGVFWDSSCTSAVYSIDWGALESGSSKSIVVYIRNEGNSASTLSLSTSNWTPSSAANYINLSWNYGGQQLSPSGILEVTLTLTISPDAHGISNFGFDIIISATS
mgnify:CR=1 FL=1